MESFLNNKDIYPDYSIRVRKGDIVIFQHNDYINFTLDKEYMVDYVTQDTRPKIYTTNDSNKDDWSFAHHFKPKNKRNSLGNYEMSFTDTENWITNELKHLFEFEREGCQSICNGISKKETVHQLFDRADKHRPSSYIQMLKKLWEETLLINSRNSLSEKISIVPQFAPLGNKIPIQQLPEIKGNNMPKTMITIEKKELEEKFNDMMLELVNDVIEGYFDEDECGDIVDSFNVYDKDEFNEAFEGTRKKERNIYVGRAITLKSMIDYFEVYVNKTGHQMLMKLIESIEE